MAKTKQKISFQVVVMNQNTADTKLIKCKLRILSISDASEGQKTQANLRWQNYIQFLTNRQYVIYPDKLMDDSNVDIAMHTSDNASFEVPFDTSNAPEPVEIPSVRGIDLGLQQAFVFYLVTPQPVEGLIEKTSESPVGSFSANMKVQLVDDNGVYADSDVVNVQAVFQSGVVNNKPELPHA